MAFGSIQLPALVQKLLLDSSGFDTAKPQAKLQAFSAQAVKTGTSMTKYMTLPLVGVGVASFKMASDLGESLSKVNVVFDKNAETIVRWSKTAATSMGMSQQQALEAAGTFGNLFRAMGLSTEAAASMSPKIVGLASDLASFNNANPEEVLLALRAGLVGETEPLRKFGVNISAARVEAEAFALGLAKPTQNAPLIRKAHLDVEDAIKKLAAAEREHGKSSDEAARARNNLELAEGKLAKATAGSAGELNAAQKAQAAYSLIMKDTALAQGDFARTSDGAANRQRILVAQLKDTAATIGTQLLPVGTKLLGWISGLVSGFGNLSPGVRTFVTILGGVLAVAGPLLVVAGKLAGAINLITAAQRAGNLAFLASPWFLIPAAIAVVVAALVVAYNKVEWFRNAVDAVGRFLAGLWPPVRDAFVAAWQKIAEVGKWAYENVLKPVWEGIKLYIEVLKVVFETWWKVVSTVWLGVAEVIKVAWVAIEVIWTAIKWYIENVLMRYFNLLRSVVEVAWAAMKDIINVVWTVFIKPVWEAITWYIENVLMRYFNLLRTVFETVWNAVATTAGWAWNSVIKPVWEAITGFVRDKLNPVWNDLKEAFTKAWESVSGVASRVWDEIESRFKSGLGVVGGIVSRILGIAAGIADAVGADNLAGTLRSKAADAKAWGLAKGGMIPAAEVGGGWVTNGARAIVGEGRKAYPEYVIPTDPAYRDRAKGLTADLAKKIGFDHFAKGGKLRPTPNYLIGGLLDAGRGVWDATGGKVVTAAGNVVEWSRGKVGEAVAKIWPTLGPGSPFNNWGGGMAAGGMNKVRQSVIDFIKGKEAEKIAKETPALTGGIGVAAMMAALRTRFPGLPLISGLRPGAITATGNPSWHGKGRAVDIPPRMDVFDWIAQNYGPQALELIFSPAGNRQLHHGRPHMYTGVTRANHWDHVHWAMAKGGLVPVKSFDSGGWLNPGLTLAHNGTGKPERVSAMASGGQIRPDRATRRAWKAEDKTPGWQVGQWRHEQAQALGSQRGVWRGFDNPMAGGRGPTRAPDVVHSGVNISAGAFTFSPIVGERVTTEDLYRLRSEMQAAFEAMMQAARQKVRR